MNLFDLTGMTAVVVGGTSSLGAAMAEGLAAHGAGVAVVGRHPGRVREVLDRIAHINGDYRYIRADATSDADLRGVLNEVWQWRGRIDVLINCPGTNSATPFFDVTMEEWDHIMDVNLKSYVRSCQIFGRHMCDHGRGGSIINVSSVSSGPPLSKVFSYSAAKSGINSITQFLARELAPFGVRVNAVIPGFFPTDQNRELLTDERRRAILAHTPMARFGDPQELQGVAVWLASPRASGFVTGALIRVDGGFGAMTI